MLGLLTSRRDEKKTTHARHTGTPDASPGLAREPAAAPGFPRFLQAKLAVGRPDDAYEREADHVAEQVLRTPAKKVQRACASCAAGGGRCPTCSAQDEKLVQRKAATASAGAGLAVSDDFLSPLRSGRPLDPGIRDFMEARFGHDFAGVRIHTDTAAAATAHSVNALAYTVGHDVVFGAGQYAPQTTHGKQVLAHELTHVIQQSSAPRSHDRGGARPVASIASRTFGHASRLISRLTCPDVHDIRKCPVGQKCGPANRGKCIFPSIASGCRCFESGTEPGPSGQAAAQGALIGATAGMILGAIGGGILGAGGGTLVAPGVGTVGGGAAGVAGGMEAGALVGGVAGGLIGGLIGWLSE
jgi:hypothetical protein